MKQKAAFVREKEKRPEAIQDVMSQLSCRFGNARFARASFGIPMF